MLQQEIKERCIITNAQNTAALHHKYIISTVHLWEKMMIDCMLVIITVLPQLLGGETETCETDDICLQNGTCPAGSACRGLHLLLPVWPNLSKIAQQKQQKYTNINIYLYLTISMTMSLRLAQRGWIGCFLCVSTSVLNTC